MNNLFYVLIAGVIAMVFSFWKTKWINSQDEGNDRMKKIGKSIADGAMAFLKAEYRILSIFVFDVAVLLALAARSQGDSMLISFSFLVGALASGLLPPVSGLAGASSFLPQPIRAMVPIATMSICFMFKFYYLIIQ